MKKIAIKLEYKDKAYLGDDIEVDNKGEKKLISIIELAAKGGLGYLTFTCQNINQFFPKKVLEESILGLVYKT